MLVTNVLILKSKSLRILQMGFIVVALTTIVVCEFVVYMALESSTKVVTSIAIAIPNFVAHKAFEFIALYRMLVSHLLIASRVEFLNHNLGCF